MSRLVVPACSVLLLLMACQDDAAGPQPSMPGSVEAYAALQQQGEAGSPVPVDPAVRVTDAGGDPVAGVEVGFTIIAGGGRVTPARAVTDAEGIARVSEWVLGDDPGVNTVEARVASLPPVLFEASAASAFTIDVRIIGSVTPRQQDAIDNAVARWRTALVRDLPDLQISAPAGECFSTQPALNELVDDLVLFVQFTPIDGAGKVLGQAGPCIVRGESHLPAMGFVQLDAADLDRMELNGGLDDLVLHEFGHVLGIGVIWTERQLLAGAGTTDPTFIGAGAVDAWHALGGTTAGVPVENTGMAGTREAHWRESVFGDELMTGYLSNASNPLSAMTIASLSDLGYGASEEAAATFALPRAPSAVFLDLEQAERIIRPRTRIFRDGERRTFDR